VPLLESALDRQDDRNHRLRPFHALWLGRASGLGELERACHDGHTALRYARMSSRPIDWHLHEFRDALRAHSRVPPCARSSPTRDVGLGLGEQVAHQPDQAALDVISRRSIIPGTSTRRTHIDSVGLVDLGRLADLPPPSARTRGARCR